MIEPKIIAHGWPSEYGGPLETLGVSTVRWNVDADIREGERGRWSWVCAPRFLSQAALCDLVTLIERGWRVSTSSRAGRVRVTIFENESERTAA